MVERSPAADAPDVSSALRKTLESDRDVMEKATKAFVSYVRAYKEHHCKYIFRLQVTVIHAALHWNWLCNQSTCATAVDLCRCLTRTQDTQTQLCIQICTQFDSCHTYRDCNLHISSFSLHAR